MKTNIASILALFAITAGANGQGSLTPPPGAPAPVMKSLDQIEPRTPLSASTTPGSADSIFRISSPGSYYLTGNLSVPSGFAGIIVASDRVSIDLAGFSIQGVAGSYSGIYRGNSVSSGLTVMNGGISGMGSYGIYNSPIGGFSPTPYNNVFENLRITDCTGYGIYASNATVRNCAVSQCNGWGISLSGLAASLVESCTASNNSGGGISIQDGLVTRSSATGNGNGSMGLGSGIAIGNSGIVRDCNIENGPNGISGSKMTVTGCTVLDCITGVSANSASLISGNHILASSLTGGSVGISCSNSGTRVEHNNIVNMTTGLKVSAGGNLIIGNSFQGNTKALNAVGANRVGTLLTGTSSIAINGNSGGGLGTSDPNANLIY